MATLGRELLRGETVVHHRARIVGQAVELSQILSHPFGTGHQQLSFGVPEITALQSEADQVSRYQVADLTRHLMSVYLDRPGDA